MNLHIVNEQDLLTKVKTFQTKCMDLENILKWMKERNFQMMMFLNLIEHKNKLMNLFIILKIF